MLGKDVAEKGPAPVCHAEKEIGVCKKFGGQMLQKVSHKKAFRQSREL